MLGISKRGDSYLRTLLIHGTRSALKAAQRKADDGGTWLTRLADRRNPNIAAVALANKNARIVFFRQSRFRQISGQMGFLKACKPVALVLLRAVTVWGGGG